MNRLTLIFLLNATVLCTHQIDAAYWHEWNLFHLPGGNQLNLILNLPIIASVFLAFSAVVSASSKSFFAHAYLISLGLLTVVLHSLFFTLGHREFLQPMSILLLVTTGLLSLGQLILLLRSR